MSDPALEDPRAGVLAMVTRVVLLCLGVAVLFGVSGGAANFERWAEWALETLSGGFFGLIAARWLVPASWYRRPLWAAALLIAAAVTVPMTGMVLACIKFLRHQPLTLALVAEVLPQVFGTSLVITALAFLIRRHPTQTHAPAAGDPPAPPPKFFSRVPAKLKGAELFAVEAEDHYLRLHTSLGQDLILLRLADAIAELEGVEGAQTHRSWWVAKDAVTKAERLDGRAVLTLKDGSEVPVSRGFAKPLRAAGWF